MIAPMAFCGPAAAADPVIAAAGDIACDPSDSGYNGGAGTATRCRQRATSNLLVGAGLQWVLPLGDIQYDSASTENIMAVYHPTWGRVKSISRPVIGNHEGSGNDYYDYFNGEGVTDGPAGPRGKGWYSFNVGSWHMVALNTNCNRVGCGAGSEQEQWLRADLAAYRTSCILAYSHHARYSSGHDGNNTVLQPLWEALDDAGAELLLSGHSHNYERIAPLDRNGDLNQANGIRQWVVGTGGAFFTGGLDSLIPHSQVAQNDTFGVLFLTLHPTGYSWEFRPEAGKTWTDTGTAGCRGAPPPPPRPPAPTLTDTDPDSPANHNSPMVKGSAAAGSMVRLYTNAACSGSPVASGSSAAFAAPGLPVSVADGSSTTFYATATNAAGNTSVCSSTSITYLERSTLPPPTGGGGPGSGGSGGGPGPGGSGGGAGSGTTCPATGCLVAEGLVFPGDTKAPGVTLAGRKSQRLGRTVSVSLTATTEDLWVTASGTVSVPGASRVFRLKALRDRMVTRGTKVALKLKLRRSARRAIKRALRRGATVKVRLKLDVRDRAGNATTRRRTITLAL
jgi:acid phosphatase type 7